MGQKVHPLGFRIGITKKHQAQWFAPFRKYKYSQTIVEDCFLRDTLTNLFPQLINPTEQKKSKRDDGNQNAGQMPRISMIRIERGLIPYEIGIQVHAENCELLKSSIENLKVKQELVANVEKSRYFLNTLKAKIEPQQDMEISVSPSRKKQTSAPGLKKMGSKKSRTKKQAATILFSKLRAKKLYAQGVNIQTNELRATNRLAGTALKTKKALIELYTRRSQKAVLGGARDGKQFRTQRPTFNRNLQTFKTLNSLLFEKSRITRRLRKRLTIRKRILARLFRGIIFQQKGNIVTRQYLKPMSAMRKKATRNRRMSVRKGQVQRFVNKTTTAKLTRRPNQPVKPTLGKKKFLAVLSAKLDQNFLKQLKQQLTVCHQEMAQHRQEQIKKYGVLKYAPLGFNRNWSLSNLNKFKQKPKSILVKSIRLIEQKAFAYLLGLRKDFKTYGTLAYSKVFAYYQIIRFLKQLKQLTRTASDRSLRSNQMNRRSDQSLTMGGSKMPTTLIETTLRTKLKDVQNECQKIKFISYLQQLVKKHRERNIFQYLRTISDARRSLKNLKQFIIGKSVSLFGIDLQTQGDTNTAAQVRSSIKSLILRSSQKSTMRTSLDNTYFENIEKEMQMHKSNITLTPRITIKFFNVQPSVVANRPVDSKASFIAASIVDQLEKRKAFRKVIKDAKQNAMKHPKIKGIKVQVSGRLNGAEIARTEWVRAGRVPLQTLRANIDYSYKTAKTIYGIIGVRIWIFKGYTQ
uniref:Small ribosomal subunit protein uS3c n=1 Tax=Hafniomonas laevis TaxID=436124 RepID=A0A0S2LNU1_9CHLO|nr:ribosomal protein S3 [Hafniomonas laevis]ALO63073.1 ribosomal protein S3 [Hafniomonas laevis]